MFRLDGKRALTTGAGSGIGEATARLFAAQGAHVLVADVQMDAAEQVAASIVKQGGSASALALDVADETQVCAAFDRVANQDGRSTSWSTTLASVTLATSLRQASKTGTAYCG